MGRLGFTRHRKVRRLARAVGGLPVAVGSLELLWGPSHEEGNPVVGDTFDVEERCLWAGDPGTLTRALLEVGPPPCRAGFIERVAGQEEFFQIHDFWDHAPPATRRSAIRRGDLESRQLPPGFVYVMRCGDLYKIGYSVDPERRLRSIAVDGTIAPAGPISLLLTIPSKRMRFSEGGYHQRYAAVRRVGEWFALEPWMLAELESEVPL